MVKMPQNRHRHGKVSPRKVILKTRVGGSRLVDMLAGEQLPRIC